jgi:hypothetical protein
MLETAKTGFKALFLRLEGATAFVFLAAGTKTGKPRAFLLRY